MKPRSVLAAAVILVSGHVVGASAQQSLSDRLSLSADTARSWALPGPFDRRIQMVPVWKLEAVTGSRPVVQPIIESSVSCPMRTFAPSGDSSASMPVIRPGTETAPMPTVRSTCVNPLAARVDR